jgi:FtsH-binding integral membrane protein
MTAPAYVPVADRDEQTRADFVVRVYQHLGIAVVAFIAVEALFIRVGLAKACYDFVASNSAAWLLVLGGFMLVSWLSTVAAHDVLNPSRQYAGLFGLVLAEALIFAPFLYYFFEVQSDGASTVWAAAVVTVLGFIGLSAVAFNTRRDLSFLRPILIWSAVCALLLIVAAVLFGLELGVWFSLAMIALAGGSVLYETQTIMRKYPEDAYVGGAVQLFASVMLLFWYVLRLFGQLRG